MFYAAGVRCGPSIAPCLGKECYHAADVGRLGNVYSLRDVSNIPVEVNGPSSHLFHCIFLQKGFCCGDGKK